MKKIIIPLLILILSSCTSLKDLTYLNGAEIGEVKDVTQKYDLTVQKDDILSIMITSQSPDLVLPFMQGGSSVSSLSQEAKPVENTYLVNSSGEINFPVLGKIKVVGLSHVQVSDLIERMIKDGGYINDPIVTVRLKNFKVIVLGDVSSPGVRTFDSERVSIFDVIASSGDVAATGKKKIVKIVREHGDTRVIASIDVTKANVFDSPYYYLKQNDIVYVNPNPRAARSGELVNNDRWFTFGLTFVTMLTSILVGGLIL